MSDWPFSPPLSPMKAQVREQIPLGDWAYEPKWDGFRMIAWSGPEIRLDSRKRSAFAPLPARVDVGTGAATSRDGGGR